MLKHFLTSHFALLYELGGVFIVFTSIIVVSGVLISRFDKIKLEDAIYFSFITALAVGFGDIAPKSRSARIVTIILAFLGLLLLGIAIAVAIHALDFALQVYPMR